ncbi:TlpA disulfide reductase family protein [Nannocystis pusilla]|uniref:Redoxin domain-containing protein n=1 Tax=Nannocystis pusilla TaxID=889268 RepID=A0ABS7U6P9_9BACT|nr:TlpA disulfide reductase family protein [Nannocystis pusilla]MBZ5715936.1 redoxin domain-containing protein [Nannocystis pusilla]
MSLGAAACGAAPGRVRERPPPAPVDLAERGADRLRDALVALDAAGCAREGEALVREHPDSGRLRAWWIGCVAATGRNFEAEALAAAMLAERPGDVWAELARVLAWRGPPWLLRPQVLSGSAALLATLPARGDALQVRSWALQVRRPGELLAFAAAEPDAPASARVTGLLYAARGEPSRLPEALAVAHAVPVEDPQFVAVARAMAEWLPGLGRPVEALAWAEAGLRRAPQAAPLLRQRWTLLAGQAGEEPVLEDIEAAIARFADRPEVLLAAADSLRALGQAGRAGPIEARILAEFASSPAAETVLHRRLAPAGAPGEAPPILDPDALALRRVMLEAFLARPRHHDPRKLEEVAQWRFEAIVADPAAGPEAIVDAVDVMLAHRQWFPDVYIEAVRALARRTPEIARAEAVARDGAAAIEAFAAALSASGYEAVDVMRRDRLAALQTVLGDMYLQAGRVDDAAAALKRAEALALGPFGELQLALAELARRRGDHERADIYLAEGTGLGGAAGEQCLRALEAAYRGRTGGLRGFPQHLAGLEDRGRVRRRAEVLGGWIEDARVAPEFTLERADGGGSVALASLRGKIAVVHFWFNTCGGCLLELPEYAAFAAAHAGDPDVAVVSVHAGGSAREVAAWMRARGHAFDVVMDAGYSERAGVKGYPSTWFLDQGGRIRFTAGGGLVRHVREEYGWRIDALRERAGTRVPAGAAAG